MPRYVDIQERVLLLSAIAAYLIWRAARCCYALIVTATYMLYAKSAILLFSLRVFARCCSVIFAIDYDAAMPLIRRFSCRHTAAAATLPPDFDFLLRCLR